MGRAERIEQGRGLADGLVERFGERIVAAGLYGSLARRDDSELSGVDLIVIEAEPGVIPSRALLYGPTIVGLTATTPDRSLAEAATIDRTWPLRADRYLNVLGLHDPGEFFRALRRAHDEAVSGAAPEVFLRAAADNLADAIAWTYKARAHASQDAVALTAVGQAATASVLTIGCTARFVFKNLAHAFQIAPGLPGVPQELEGHLRRALVSGGATLDAVTAIENAVEVLLADALRKDVPFTAEGLDDYLN